MRLLLAVRARCQNALSFSRGCEGGSTLIFLPSESVVMAARVGSSMNVPVFGPFALRGVVGLEAGVEAIVMARSAMVGVPGLLFDALPAAFFRSSSLAICSSRDSSSVASPSSSASWQC